MDISFERIEGTDFILGAVYGSSIFKTVSVFSIFGLVWQTETVTSTSWVAVTTACYDPWVTHQKKKKGVSINSHKEIGRHAEVKRITSAGFAADYLQPRSQGLFPSQGKGPGNEVGLSLYCDY